MSRRRKYWPPDRLLDANRNAITVFGALLWLAEGKRQVNPTRAKIRDVCHLSEDTISKAIGALKEGGWIILSKGWSGHVSWYRITLPEGCFLPVAQDSRHRVPSQADKNRPQGNRPCTAKKQAPSLKKKRAVLKHPPLRLTPGRMTHRQS